MTIWELFPDIASAVREKHQEVGLSGHHDWVHAFRAGEVARKVAIAEWNDERLSHLAGLAGLCHNADRLVQKKMAVGRDEVPKGEIEKLIRYWLALSGSFDGKEEEEIISAVFNHDARNSPEDQNVLVALMDGDRIVNLDVDFYMRAGQYFPELPAVDFEYFLDDPQATYKSPRSVLKDIAYTLDWINEASPVCVRTRLARMMAEERLAILRSFLENLKIQLAQEGIYPYPFKD